MDNIYFSFYKKVKKESVKNLEEFIRFLERKIGSVNRSDQSSMESVLEIMETRLAVYGDLFVE